jgi:hypothetical protein
MWEQSMQVEALRLLSAWWDERRSRDPSGRRRTGAAPGATAADVLALPPGATPAPPDEPLAEAS